MRALVLALLCSCLPALSPSPSSLEDVTVTLQASFVSDGDEEHITFCGGTWISQDEILTAGHCVRALDEIREIDPRAVFGYATKSDAAMRDFAVVKEESAPDLGIVRALAPSGHKWARLGDALSVGDALYSSNHVNGSEYSWMRGYVSGVRYEQGMKTYQIVMPAYFGSSGAGVFDESGKLQGVFSYIKRSEPGQVYCVHRDHIADWLSAR